MRILIISVFPPTQIADADHAYRTAMHLADAGVDVHVLTQVGAVSPQHPRLHVHAQMRRWDWAEMLLVLRCIRECKPDAILLVYIGHMYGNQPMIRFAPTMARLSRPRARFVTQIEHVEPNIQGRTRIQRGIRRVARVVLKRGPYWLYGTLLRDSRRVIVLSGSFLPFLEDIQRGVTAKSFLIPPPVLLRMSPPEEGETRRRQREAIGVSPSEMLLVYLGYLYKGKGVETLLGAFAQICSRRDDVRLAIVGGTVAAGSDPVQGYAQQMRDMVDHLGISDRVVFSGGFDQDDDHPSRYLRAADIAVLPFDTGVHMNNSSFAGVAAHGLPVITTRGADLEEPFVEGQNVLLCPPKEPERLAEAIEAVMDDHKLRHMLQDGAARLAQEWFSWDGATRRFLAALRPDAKQPFDAPAPSSRETLFEK